MSIIIAGDFSQLPPVRAKALFAEHTDHSSQEQINGKNLYHLFENIVVFDQNKRQENAQKSFQEGFCLFFFFGCLFFF